MSGRTALLAVLFALSGCGGDDPQGPGSVSARNDPPAKDARVDDGEDSGAPPLVTVDAGPPDSGAPAPPDEDAGPPRCRQRDCRRLNDACNTFSCNEQSGECESTERPNGTACGDASSGLCDGADSCVDGTCRANHHSVGSICGDHDVPCHGDDVCNANGQCIEGGLATAGSACGSSTTSQCDQPDTCDALGTCQPNHAAEDTPCGPQGVECQWDDRCDASGNCVDRGYWATDNGANCPPGRAHASGNGCSCGTTVESECRYTDICVDGQCQANYFKPPDTSCGSSAGSDCDGPDTCDGSGTCQPNYATEDSSCGPLGVECQLDDQCDGAGQCIDRGFAPQGTPCSGSLVCDGFGFCI